MIRLASVLVLLLFLCAPLTAQPGARGTGGGRIRVPDPVLFSGPPIPEDFLDLAGLDSAQYNAYRMLYTAFMEQTRPQRDSLNEVRRRARDAWDAGAMPDGMAGGRAGGDKLQKTMGELEKRQKAFDESLKAVLTESQFKRYEAWRKEEIARAEREMRERFGGPPR